MVKISSTTDPELREFKSLIEREATKGVLEDDRPTTKAAAADDATLAPGLDGVEGIEDAAKPEDVEKGDSTRVTQLEYDEYDASRPEDD